MKKRKTLAQKKEMSGIDTLTGKSKYAQKFRSQRHGNFSVNSPFNPNKSTREVVPFVRGINFLKPIDEV